MGDDRELIQALRERLPGAWSAFCEAHLPVIVHAARRTLERYGRRGADADAEDVACDLLQAILQDDCRLLGTIREPYDLKGWLIVSARRRAIDFLRKRGRAAVSLDAIGEEILPDLSGAEDAGGPDEATKAEVARAVATLGARERLVINLFYLQGKSYREIAAFLGVSINTVSPTLRHAVDKLRIQLRQRGITNFE